MSGSLYEDLGVKPDADDDEIRAAHRESVKKHHPDRGGDRETFEKIQRAALVLRDPQKRRRYDRTGTVDEEPEDHRTLKAATRMLQDAFGHALEAEDLSRTNITAIAQQILELSLQQLRGKRPPLQRKHDRLLLALKRGRFKGQGFDILSKLMNDQIADLADELKDLQVGETVHLRALAMAKDYSWEVDAAPAYTAYAPASFLSRLSEGGS